MRIIKLILIATAFWMFSDAAFAATPLASSAPIGSAPVPGQAYRDCPLCPEMVVVPGGKFVAYDFSDDHKVHMTEIRHPFSIGIFDVTREQYAAFVKDTHKPKGPGCQFMDGSRWRTDDRLSWDHPGFPQTKVHPVVCVSWNDAADYVAWLNSKLTPKSRAAWGSYRFPTANEWEFVARGGDQTFSMFYWGSEVDHDRANYGTPDCWPCGVERKGRDHWLYTAPVGSFDPNVFGVYDIVGNVWQWTSECADDFLMGDAGSVAPSAQTGGAAIRTCNTRFVRGGSFNDRGPAMRIFPRNPFRTHVRNNTNGFRVVRTQD